jgi:hypothetical protein
MIRGRQAAVPTLVPRTVAVAVRAAGARATGERGRSEKKNVEFRQTGTCEAAYEEERG